MHSCPAVLLTGSISNPTYTAVCSPSSPYRDKTLVRYQDRIAEVLGEARGQRAMIRSIHVDGRERRTAVKWINLLPLDGRHF